MSIPFANRNIACIKPVKNSTLTVYPENVSFSFKASIQQSSLEDLALGINPTPTDRTMTIYCDTTNQIKVADKLVDQETGENWIVNAVKRFVGQGAGVDYVLVIGVQDVQS